MCGKAVIVKVLERFYWQLSEGTMMSTKGERKKRKHEGASWSDVQRRQKQERAEKRSELPQLLC